MMISRQSLLVGALALLLFPAAAQAAENDKTGTIDQTLQVTEENHEAMGWTAYELGDSSVDFTGRGPASPLGSDSAEMRVPDDGRGAALLHFNQFARTRLSDLGKVAFWTNVQSRQAEAGRGHEAAPYVYLNIDQDRDGDMDDVIVYEPTFNGDVVRNTWQNWQADQGLWHSAGGRDLFHLGEYTARYPEATLVAVDPAANPELYLNLSNVEGWDGFLGNLEGYTLEMKSPSAGAARTFDFEDPGTEAALDEVPFGSDAAFDAR